MSTKIYNGIKFKSNNIAEITQQLQDVRHEILKICNTPDVISDNDLIDFISYFDLVDLNQEIKLTDVVKVHNKMIDALVNETELGSLFLRFKFSVYIIPHKDGNIYGGIFCDNNIYYKYINPYIEDFHYQDQTDKPEEITEDEWENRRNIWDKIFDKYWSFSEVGLKYEIIGSKDFRMYKRIEPILNDLKKSNDDSIKPDKSKN